MKKTCIIATAVIGLVLAAPVSAHHLCNAGYEVCPEDIGDAMDYHDDAYSALLELEMGGRMDPSTDEDPADNMAETANQSGGGADDAAGEQPKDVQFRPGVPIDPATATNQRW